MKRIRRGTVCHKQSTWLLADFPVSFAELQMQKEHWSSPGHPRRNPCSCKQVLSSPVPTSSYPRSIPNRGHMVAILKHLTKVNLVRIGQLASARLHYSPNQYRSSSQDMYIKPTTTVGEVQQEPVARLCEKKPGSNHRDKYKPKLHWSGSFPAYSCYLSAATTNQKMSNFSEHGAIPSLLPMWEDISLKIHQISVMLHLSPFEWNSLLHKISQEWKIPEKTAESTCEWMTGSDLDVNASCFGMHTFDASTKWIVASWKDPIDWA